jgi:predicted type IV restriction endonuclease
MERIESVILHNEERYYHSEWVSKRDESIGRLEKEKTELLSLIETQRKALEQIAERSSDITAKHVAKLALRDNE